MLSVLLALAQKNSVGACVRCCRVASAKQANPHYHYQRTRPRRRVEDGAVRHELPHPQPQDIPGYTTYPSRPLPYRCRPREFPSKHIRLGWRFWNRMLYPGPLITTEPFHAGWEVEWAHRQHMLVGCKCDIVVSFLTATAGLPSCHYYCCCCSSQALLRLP